MKVLLKDWDIEVDVRFSRSKRNPDETVCFIKEVDSQRDPRTWGVLGFGKTIRGKNDKPNKRVGMKFALARAVEDVLGVHDAFSKKDRKLIWETVGDYHHLRQ